MTTPKRGLRALSKLITPAPRAPSKLITPTPTNNNNEDLHKDSEEENTPLPAAHSVKKTTTPKKESCSANAKAKATNKKKTRQSPVRKGIRVKSRRSQLFHCLSTGLQKHLPQEHPNYHNCCGTVVRKNNGKKGCARLSV